MKTIRAEIWIVLLGTLAFLPFINRPLYVDDHAVFVQAKRLAHHWQAPHAGDTNPVEWSGSRPSEANGPVYFYLMAAARYLSGPEEWKAHLFLIPFHLAALLGFFYLARRYTCYPFWASLLWLTTPHFYLTANSLLADALLAPAMILGIVFWMKGWETKQWGWSLASGLILGLAPLIKYSGLLSWGVVALWTLLEAQERRSVRWLFLGIPVVMMSAWIVWTRMAYGQSHLGALAADRLTHPSGLYVLLFMVFLSGSTLCVFLTFFLARGLAAVLLAAGLTTGLLLHPHWQVGIPMGAWLGISLVWLLAVIPRQRPTKKWIGLAVWVLAGGLGLSFAEPWVCARYLVIVGPAVVLLTVLALEDRGPSLLASRAFRIGTVVVLGLATGILTVADYSQARADHQAAMDAEAWRQANWPHMEAYYPGALMGGAGYYLAEKNWKPLDPGAQTPYGSLVLLPWRNLPRQFFPVIHRPQTLTSFIYRTRNPLRTFDPPSGAGFYGSIWGPLPFSFSRDPLEIYTLLTPG